MTFDKFADKRFPVFARAWGICANMLSHVNATLPYQSAWPPSSCGVRR